jgi:hypothetical protein
MEPSGDAFVNDREWIERTNPCILDTAARGDYHGEHIEPECALRDSELARFARSELSRAFLNVQGRP